MTLHIDKVFKEEEQKSKAKGVANPMIEASEIVSVNFAMRPFSNYKVLLKIEQLVLEGQRLRTKQRHDEDPISKSRIEVQIQQKREEIKRETEHYLAVKA